jgi:hypothetical protein
LILDRENDLVKESNVTVLQTLPTGEFPPRFDGVELQTVGRQEVKRNLWGLLIASRQMEFGAMILHVVASGYYTTAGNGAQLAEHLKELRRRTLH